MQHTRKPTNVHWVRFPVACVRTNLLDVLVICYARLSVTDRQKTRYGSTPFLFIVSSNFWNASFDTFSASSTTCSTLFTSGT